MFAIWKQYAIMRFSLGKHVKHSMTPNQRSAAAKKAFRSRKRKAEARVEVARPSEVPVVAKSARIKVLLAEGLSRQEIAERVGCTRDCVRAVIQRLEHPDRDRDYCRRYRDNPEYRAAKAAYMRMYYHRKRAEANAA